MDMDSKRVLYENNIHEKKLIASTTKIMTAIVVIENNKNLNKKITIGEEILSMYGTNIYIELGEKISIKDLLYGLLLRSGNDSAIALATYTAKTEEKFVEIMNKKAKELGMNNTTFQNSHGLDDYTKNYSTAYDMALLSSYAYKNPIYREISSTKKYTTTTKNKTYLWYNRNKLLNQYEYCTGGKNGYTPDAGRTLVTTASKDNLNLTTITLNDPNEYQTHQELYNKNFNKYKNYKIIEKENFKISKSIYEEDVYIKESFTYPLTEEELESIKTKIHITNKNNSEVGKIQIELNNKVIKEIPIYKKIQKKEESTLNKLFQKLKSLFI
jgi:D-alanyl-D-alanine carboxypeptidase